MHITPDIALSSWLPYKLREQETAHWMYTGTEPYTEPFFDETIHKCRSLPENSKLKRSVSSCDILPEWSLPNTLQPSAIIFHVSRCGSTLLSQLLGIDKRHVVLSEVPFFDELLRAKYAGTGKDLSALLPHAISFYGQKRVGNETRLFIKSDSWHLFFYEQWRALYPGIPFILLYRRPDEVIFSQEKKRGMHAVPGVIEKEVFTLGNLPEDFHLNPNGYMAAVLEQYYTKMKQIHLSDSNAYLINYNEGLATVAEKVYTLTHTSLQQADRQAFQERCVYDAKEPEKNFQGLAPDESKIAPYMEKAFQLYQALELLRVPQ
ncbi:hypothetical protein HNQ91_003363 [Filimonas zeae]|uniref:Sulfotransferase family protein n=1 Tax=Filimonas zeae TaxID=1737353 RepID=A0A917J1F6_9BACT|nr:sulfotransferase family protein [Filimonas zeae]MDR6340298.1 hypothetical protein [Filimonas zeae]GGH72074.1 sulfotransferase family protein [Filimonas zeae]